MKDFFELHMGYLASDGDCDAERGRLMRMRSPGPQRALPHHPNRGSLGAKSTAALLRLHAERGFEQRASITSAATLSKYDDCRRSP